jgi:multimeric flavodoxin WrbA
MKIMTVLGSPKMEGNTAGALKMFEDAVGGTHEIERVNLPTMDVMGCQGCYACQQKPNEPSCVVRDDATEFLKRIVEVDAVVYASPLYMWGFASKLHGFLERHLSLVTGYGGGPDYVSLLEGKKVAYLLTCGGPVENNTEHVQGVIDNMSGYSKANLVGKYIVAGATVPDEIESKAADVIAKMAADFAA